MLGQLIWLRLLDHERQVIVAPGGPTFELRIRGYVQDKVLCYPQGDDGTLAAMVLFETERFQPQDVPVEVQGSIEILNSEIGVIRTDYLQASSPVRLQGELNDLIFVGRFRGTLAEDQTLFGGRSCRAGDAGLGEALVLLVAANGRLEGAEA